MTNPKEKDPLSNSDKYYAIAGSFVREKNLICFNDTFYLFNEGIWRLESTENTESWIAMDYLSRFAKAPTISQIREIVKAIKVLTYDNKHYRDRIKYMDNGPDINRINVSSGILDLTTMETKPYDKDDFCFHKLGFDYQPGYSCPTMLKFLSTSMGFDWPVADETEEYSQIVGFFQEVIGYSLVPGNKFEKAIIMTGRGRNGKGTLIHIWARILGDHNVSSKSIKALNDPQVIGHTKNKLVNFSYDEDRNVQLDTGVIKAAIVGEPVDCNEKWKDPHSFVFTAKLVIACNDLPFTTSTDDNVRERFIVIPFNRRFGPDERDYDLKKKLESEIGGIFSWSVDGLIRLRKRGKLLIPQRFSASLEQFLFDNDTVEQWIDEKQCLDANRRTKRSDVWASYRDFCKDSNSKPYGRNRFFKQLEKKGHVVCVVNGERYLSGIKPNEIVDGIGDSDTYIEKPKEVLPF